MFAASPAGPIPVGEATGTAIVAPGRWPCSLWARLIAWFARWFLWQGKIFSPHERCLRNRVSAFSLTAIKADVYEGKSWFDDQDCIVIDYSKTSLLAKHVRDEMREVRPGVLVGNVWFRRLRVCDFVLASR